MKDPKNHHEFPTTHGKNEVLATQKPGDFTIKNL